MLGLTESELRSFEHERSQIKKKQNGTMGGFFLNRFARSVTYTWYIPKPQVELRWLGARKILAIGGN